MLLNVLLAIVLLPLAFLNLLAPLMILKTQRIAARVKFTPLPEDEFLAARSDTYNRLDTELKQMGFVYGGSSVLKDTHTESYFSLYSLPGDAACAMLVTINSPVRNMTYLEFCQVFADDTVLDVNNADVVSAYPAMKQKTMLRYPDVNEPAALLDIFRRVRAAIAQRVALKAWDPAQGIALVEQALAREADELLRLGFCLEPVDADGKRSLTLAGAYRLTWKSVFPGKQIQNWRDLRRARAVLRRT